MKFSGQCPVCGEHLHLARLACPGCKAEFPTDEPLLPYNYLSEEDAQFLKTFLVCRGSLKDVQAQMNISYPTAKKRLEELLLRLGLRGEEENEEEVDMSLFKKQRQPAQKHRTSFAISSMKTAARLPCTLSAARHMSSRQAVTGKHSSAMSCLLSRLYPMRFLTALLSC